jgi:hypothetical protein
MRSAGIYLWNVVAGREKPDVQAFSQSVPHRDILFRGYRPTERGIAFL